MRNSLASRKNDERQEHSDLESGGLAGGGRSRSSRSAAEWRRVLYRVPAQMRERKKHMYDPCVVSLGPYHHAHPDLRQLQDFKFQVVNLMLKEDQHQLVFRNKIQEGLGEIRHFYGGLSRDEYDDDALAQMMLHDACLLLYCIEMMDLQKDSDEDEEEGDERVKLTLQHLGAFQASLMICDCYKVENQIPWWVLEFLVRLKYDGEREVMRSFLSFQTYGDNQVLEQIPWDEEDDDDQPLHLLQALAETAQRNEDNTCIGSNSKKSCRSTACKWWKRPPAGAGVLHPEKRPFRSVTELKAKGIHVRLASSRNIEFSSYYLFGVLYLPLLVVYKDSLTIYSNIVAWELSPGKRHLDCIMASYFGLMKSMVEKPRDVKALQEKAIIVSFIDDSEEIVRMLKEMDSYGSEGYPVYDKIKMRINNHCNSKAKTWIAELFNTRFRSPWTATALAAAALLLCLTFLQTYFTILPRK